MSELVEWLRGVLDEDERIALEGDDPYEGPGLWVINDYDITQRDFLVIPRRAALADIAAKRKIIEHHDLYGEDDTYLRLLASAYAHRPGYRTDWA